METIASIMCSQNLFNTSNLAVVAVLIIYNTRKNMVLSNPPLNYFPVNPAPKSIVYVY